MRPMRIGVFFFFIVVFCQPIALAQRFGGNPASMKWKQINTPHLRLIFPEGVEKEAQRAAQIMEGLSNAYDGSLGEISKKIPVVLQPQPLVSNAYVGLAPWRSEFYMNPLQNALSLGSTSWMDNLAVHEYRHVHQFSNFNKGLSRWAGMVAGEQGLALAVSAAVPDWFYEGDAVFHETKFLSQGRGRLPYFFDAMHAIWKADKQYGIQKLRNGSLKDLVPDHYTLGYLLVTHGYKKYGDDFWGKVTGDAVRYKGLFYPFQRAVKRHSGMHYPSFVSDALQDYRAHIKKEAGDSSAQPLLAVDTRKVIDYHYPVWYGMDSVLVLKKAYNRLPQWVVIAGGEEISMGVKEIALDDYFTYHNHKIVYTSYRPDARWSWREYNEILVYDLVSQQKTRLGRGGRYFSPALSHDGKRIVAVNVFPGGKSSLHILDLSSGEKMADLSHPQGEWLSYPIFSARDSSVYVLSRKPNGENALLELDLFSFRWKTVLPYVNAPLAFLREVSRGMLFNLSQSGRNQLIRFDPHTGNRELLASDITGSYVGDIHPVLNKLVFTKPGAEGEQLFTKKLSSEGAAPLHSFELRPLSTVYACDSTMLTNGASLALNTIKDSSYSATPYRPFTRPVNIHSWRPLYERPEWSLTLYGENVLNTVVSSYSYVYNENEGSHRLGGNLALGRLYPWILLGTNYTLHRTYRDLNRQYHWNEWNGQLGFRLPFNFTSGKLFRRVDFSSGFNAVGLWYDNKNTIAPKDRFIQYAYQQFGGALQTQRAVQHIFPRFAWSWNLQNRFAFGSTTARQLFLGSQWYLPGLMRNHALVLGASFQSRDTLQQYLFSNSFPSARGYAGFDFPRMARFSFNYHMPLVYPDFGFANIVYFLRVRSNFFFDLQKLKSLRTGTVSDLRSAGLEIFFDTKWWNQQPVNFGVRYSRLFDAGILPGQPKANRFEIILPLDLIPN